MQDNPLLVGPKKENCECRDRPILFFGGGGSGDCENPSFINLVLKNNRGREGGLKFFPLKKGGLILEDVRNVQ